MVTWMPRVTYRVSDGELGGFEIIWFYDEWCKLLPDAWLDACNCRRCCNADAFFSRYPRIHERLERDMVALLCKWNGIYWYVRYYPRENRVCIAPWPRRLYRRIF